MKKRSFMFSFLALIVLILTACGGNSSTSTSADSSDQGSASDKYADYYKGKKLTILVGYNPGGGTDLESRIMAKHIVKYLPGKPNVVIQNIPGGGGITAANQLYSSAEPDGYTLATPGRTSWISNAITGNDTVKYKVDELEWLGSSGSGAEILITTKASKIKTLDDLKAAPKESLAFGAWSKTSAPYVGPYLLNKAVAPSVQAVTGYGGSGDVILAMERDEIQGAFIAHSPIDPKDIENGKYNLLATTGGYTKKGIPNISEVLTGDELKMFNLVSGPGLGVPFVGPPGMDPELSDIIKEAYAKTVKDPEFLAEVEAQGINFFPLTGDEVNKFIQEMIATDKSIVDAVNEIVSE